MSSNNSVLLITIIISLFNLYSFVVFDYENDLIKQSQYQCSKDFVAKNICGLFNEETGIFKINKQCKKNEQCMYTPNRNAWQCVKKVSLLENGKKCYQNEECLSKYCLNKKCQGKAEGHSCTHKDECSVGSYCDETKKCKKYEREGGSCKTSEECGARLLCNDNKCTELSTVATGNPTTNQRLCTTGMAYGGVCIKVQQDVECESDGQCSPIVEGLDGSGVQKSLTVKCIEINSVKVCPYSTLKQRFYSEYSEAITGLDADKFFSDEGFALAYGTNSIIFGEPKAAEAYYKYKYYELLSSIGAFDSTGDVKSDLKCEVDFLLMQASADFNQVKNILLIVSFIFILF